jgi:hypothetical protein
VQEDAEADARGGGGGRIPFGHADPHDQREGCQERQIELDGGQRSGQPAAATSPHLRAPFAEIPHMARSDSTQGYRSLAVSRCEAVHS